MGSRSCRGPGLVLELPTPVVVVGDQTPVLWRSGDSLYHCSMVVEMLTHTSTVGPSVPDWLTLRVEGDLLTPRYVTFRFKLPKIRMGMGESDRRSGSKETES